MSTTKTLSQMLETFSPRTEHWGLLDKMADMARALEERVAELEAADKAREPLTELDVGRYQARAEAAEAEIARLREAVEEYNEAENGWYDERHHLRSERDALRAKLEKVRAECGRALICESVLQGRVLRILDGEGSDEA